MTLTQPELMLFRSLKRTAIVLLLMIRIDKPIGEKDVAAYLDLHPQTARSYLRSLSQLNLIARAQRYNGYILTTLGRQMTLDQAVDKLSTPVDNPPPAENGSATLSRSPNEEKAGSATLSRSSAKLSRSQAPSITSSSSILLNPNRPTTTRETTAIISPSRINENIEALEEESDGEIDTNVQTIQDLAAMPHLNPDYIHKHLSADLDIALIIWRMKQKWTPPRCNCERCRTKAFQELADRYGGDD